MQNAANADSSEYFDLVESITKVSKNSFLGLLSQKETRELLKNYARLSYFQPGENIPRSNKPSEIVVVCDGLIAYVEIGGKKRKISEHGPGTSLESDVVLSENPDQTWRFDWRAENPVTVIRLDLKGFFDVIGRDSELLKYMRLTEEHQEILKLKNDLLLLGLKPKQSIKMIAALDEKTVEKGKLDIDRQLVLIKSGSFTLLGEIDEKLKVVGKLSVGEYAFVECLGTRYGLAAATKSTFWTISLDQIRQIAGSWDVETFLNFSNKARQKVETILASKISLVGGINHTVDELEDEEDESGLEVKDFKATEAELKKAHKKKPIIIKQHDLMDCGAACLSMVSRFHGKRISVADCRSLVSVTREGASLLSLQNGARATGLQAIGILSGVTGLKNIQVPFIALMQYHFVVVYKFTDDVVVLGDPAVGIRKLSVEEFKKEFSKNILAIKPGDEFKNYPESQYSYTKYLKIFRGHGKDLLHIATLTLLAFVFGLFTPFLMQFLFDEVIMGKRADILTATIGAFLALKILNNAIGWFNSYWVTHLSSALDLKFSSLFFRHTLRLPLSYFATRNVGDFTIRFGELSTIRSFMLTKPLTIPMVFLNLFIYSAIVWWYCPAVMATIAIALPFFITFFVVISPKVTSLMRESIRANTKSQSMLIEQIKAIDTLKSIGGTVAARWKWTKLLSESMEISIRNRKFTVWVGIVRTLMNEGLTNIIMIVAVFKLLDNELTVGQLIAVTTMAQSVIGPAVSLVSEYKSFQEIGVSFGRIDDVITAQTDHSDVGSTPYDSLVIKGEIEFKNVEFRYGNENSPLILSNISFKINEGETVAFVGRSGCGKTTLAYMINGLYRPTAGSILIDGIPLTDIPNRVLRHQVSMVMQQNALFARSIIDNIAIDDPSPNFQRVIKAAELADAHGFISELKEGYSAILGESGSGLSGGQKQRIGIARAFYRPSPVLIMDEATSALDRISEAHIMKSLAMKNAKQTRVIIAHRMNTIIGANRIFVLDHGRIIESGSHQQLISGHGAYFKLFQAQLAS